MMTQKKIHWHSSPRGIVRITGPDRVPFVQRMCTQDVRPLQHHNVARLALFLNAKGRLIDEVLALSQDEALVLQTAPHRAWALVQWLTPYTIMEELSYEVVTEAATTFTVVTDAAAPMPHAVEAVLKSLGFARVPAADEVVPGGQPGVWATATRKAFGPGVVMTATDAAQATLIADALEGALGTMLTEPQRDAWLLSTGVASAELDYPTPAPPFELRLGQESIHWHKGCYIGQEIISRLEAYDKVARLMMGIAITGGVAHSASGTAPWRIMDGAQAVGKISRVVPDAMGTGLVGLCIVKRDVAKPMDVAVVDGAGNRFPAALFDCPQWQR